MKRHLLFAALGVLCVQVTAFAQVEDPAKAGPDQQFVQKASASGLAEVTLGKIAQERAGSPEVKKFAQQMINDHGKANKELMELAAKKSLKPSQDMVAEHQALMVKLQKLSGAEFDREYLIAQIKDHKDAVTLFDNFTKSGQDDDLKKWAGEKLPNLKEHLKMAEEIHGKLEGSGGK